MSYDKKVLDDAAGKIRGIAQELMFLAEQVQFESGMKAATDRSHFYAKSMQDEFDRLHALHETLLDQTKAGIEAGEKL